MNFHVICAIGTTDRWSLWGFDGPVECTVTVTEAEMDRLLCDPGPVPDTKDVTLRDDQILKIEPGRAGLFSE